MSAGRWAALWCLLWSAALATYLFRVSKDPAGTAGGLWVMKALDSWFFRTRWSASPQRRVRRMALVAVLLAVLMLYVLIFDPAPRYHR